MNMPRNESAPGATLRALNHAQGQLMQSHDDLLLYFAADTLDILRRENIYSAIAAACPDAARIVPQLAPLAGDPATRENMFSWEKNRAMAQGRDALRAIAAHCRFRTGQPGGNGTAFRRAGMIAESASAYLDMAADIRDPGLSGIFHLASRVNPYISAAFIAEYARIAARRLESAGAKNSLYASFAARLDEQRSLILCNLPEDGGASYAPMPALAQQARNVMAHLGRTADIAEQIMRARGKLGDRDLRLDSTLAALFQTAAVYDWAQYEAAHEVPAPAGTRPGSKNNNDNRMPRPLAPVIPLFGTPGGVS